MCQKVACNTTELARFFSQLNPPVQAVVESTSNWYWLDDWCKRNGIPLKLAHANMLKAISYAKVKTDKVDATTIAELSRGKLIPEAWKTEKRQRELRELTRGRLKCLHLRDKIQNQTRSTAQKYNVTIKSGQWRHHLTLKKWLHEQLSDEIYVQTRLLLDLLAEVQKCIHQIEKEIDRHIWYEEDLKRLLEIPGIGTVSAWTILAEIGDITRFSSADKFVSYCRLVPGSDDSGDRRRHKSSKDGNKYLRMAFGHAAIGAYTHHKVVKSFYERKRKKKGPFIARTLVAKELARIVWYILAQGHSYKGFKGKMTDTNKCSSWPQPVSPDSMLG